MNGLYLAHHGIKGQKWGVRNYQNADGTLTPEGRERYGVGDGSDIYKENFKSGAKAFGKSALAVGAGVGRSFKAAGRAAKATYNVKKDRHNGIEAANNVDLRNNWTKAMNEVGHEVFVTSTSVVSNVKNSAAEIKGRQAVNGVIK